MKNILVFVVISFVIVQLPAQDCNDVVYPSSVDSIIFDCCINEVKYGNIVSYIKDNKRHIIEAERIVKDGKPYDLKPNTSNPVFIEEEKEEPVDDNEPKLYENHEYRYYQQKYNSAKVQAGIGIFLTITGATANIASVILASDSNPSNDRTGTYLNIYGILAFNSGLPIWISGAVKKVNNRKAMKRIKNSSSNSSLTFGFTNNGIGLLFYL